MKKTILALFGILTLAFSQIGWSDPNNIGGSTACYDHINQFSGQNGNSPFASLATTASGFTVGKEKLSNAIPVSDSEKNNFTLVSSQTDSNHLKVYVYPLTGGPVLSFVVDLGAIKKQFSSLQQVPVSFDYSNGLADHRMIYATIDPKSGALTYSGIGDDAKATAANMAGPGFSSSDVVPAKWENRIDDNKAQQILSNYTSSVLQAFPAKFANAKKQNLCDVLQACAVSMHEFKSSSQDKNAVSSARTVINKMNGPYCSETATGNGGGSNKKQQSSDDQSVAQ